MSRILNIRWVCVLLYRQNKWIHERKVSAPRFLLIRIMTLTLLTRDPQRNTVTECVYAWSRVGFRVCPSSVCPCVRSTINAYSLCRHFNHHQPTLHLPEIYPWAARQLLIQGTKGSVKVNPFQLCYVKTPELLLTNVEQVIIRLCTFQLIH